MESSSDPENGRPAGIFWDIENIKKGNLQKLIDWVRKGLIIAKQLDEVQFSCVAAINILKSEEITKLHENSIDFETFENDSKQKDLADLKLIKLMENFVDTYKNRSVIILISSDGGYTKSLFNFKKKFINLLIYVIHYQSDYSVYPNSLADETYVLTEDSLELFNDRLNVVTVRITGIPDKLDRDDVKTDLIEKFGYIGGSKEAIYFDSDGYCWINFESIPMAKLVVKTKKDQKIVGVPIKLEYIVYPPDNVVKELFKLDQNNSVRNNILVTIRNAISYEYRQSWENSTNTILPFKLISPKNKNAKMMKCILITGYPEFGFGCVVSVEWFEKKFQKKVEILWSDNNSVALKIMENNEMIKFLEMVNRFTESNLVATLSLILIDTPEIAKQKLLLKKILKLTMME